MKEKMQNLVKLLNEYEKWKSEKYIHWNYVWWYDEDIWCIFASRFPDNTFISFDESIAIIICKWYNFIKRLVKNNKIDISMLWKKSDMWFGDKYTRDESLLMLLSISNKPIKDLISILR